MLEETLILFRNIRNPDYDKSLKGYKKAGGLKALKQALEMQPDEIVQLTKDSGLRGRGGAGFPSLDGSSVALRSPWRRGRGIPSRS